ncbi:MAG TPA: DNA polymerase I [Candidatus Subteraquimicrobiales bacterium]
MKTAKTAKTTTKKKIVLIDGPSLVYRAFYALPTTLATKEGLITNAVYGFTSMLIRLLGDVKPDVLLVAFDKPGPTFRHEAFEDYKAHRPETPDDLKSQIPLVKEILEVLKIPLLEMAGFEADDILATLAKKGSEEKDEVIIVTADRDMLQLVNREVTVMSTRRGITDMKAYNPQNVTERFGLPPEKIPDMLGLKGDPSDNIPGVPGIGEKTAAKLIQEYGTIEKVLENIDQIPQRFQKALKQHKEQALLSKELATLIYDVPIEVNFDQYRVGEWEDEKVAELFSSLEFNTLLERLKIPSLAKTKVKEESFGETKVVASENDLKMLGEKLDKCQEIALEIVAGAPNLFGQGLEALIIAPKENKENKELREPKEPKENLAFYLPIDTKLQTLSFIRPYLEDDSLKKVVYDGKSQIITLNREGINLKGLSFDVLIAAYLLEPTAAEYPLANLIEKYLLAKLPSPESTKNLGQRALALLKLKQVLEEELKQRGLWRLFIEVEVPLVSVLAKMEMDGVSIDSAALNDFSKEIELMISKLEEEIFSLADEQFNISSPQQLRKILFEKLGLKTQKKTKTGYSTDSSVLIKLASAHPIIEKILNYRELTKLKSTYTDVFPKLIDSQSGRLHTSFNQTVTATGRLSSSNPNLQNIPIRTELGRRIREAFVAKDPSHKLLVADYSQIELRILAHLAEDKNLLKAFEEGKDIHRATASEVFGVEPEDVTPQMRRRAKAVNFGIVYGISGRGLSEQLRISKEEAQDYIDKYLERYPQVKEFMEKIIAQGYRDGCARTIMGRLRELPELKSSNYQIKSFGERLAINTPIQGSAADIIKMAMVKLDKKLEEAKLKTKMLLQVHDELVFEVPKNETDRAKSLIKEVMENIYPLKAKLEVDIVTGPNWREAH